MANGYPVCFLQNSCQFILVPSTSFAQNILPAGNSLHTNGALTVNQPEMKCIATQTESLPGYRKTPRTPAPNPFRRKRGSAVTRKERRILKSVHHVLHSENACLSPDSQLDDAAILKRAAHTAGLSPRTLARELEKNSDDETPGKKRPKKNGIKRSIDTFDRDALLRLLYSMHDAGEKVTVSAFTAKATERGLFDGKTTTMYHIMTKELNLKYKKPNSKEKFRNLPDKLILRFKFLKKFFKLKKKGAIFVWTDETWTNQNGTETKVWTNDSPDCTTRLKPNPGKRFIIVHAGTKDGFLRGASLTFPSKVRYEDYHGDMDATYFLNWVLKQLIPNLPPKAVLIMDNAPYHSEKLQRIPRISWTIHQLQEWLKEREISYDHILSGQRRKVDKTTNSATGKNEKEALFDLAIANCAGGESYVVDSLLEKHGFQVLRLPPYHCDYNPIEMIWGIVKQKYNDILFTKPSPWNVKTCMESWNEALATVSNDTWANCVRHAEELMEKEFAALGVSTKASVTENDLIMSSSDSDEEQEEERRFIIPLIESSSDESSSDEEVLAEPINWEHTPARGGNQLRDLLLEKRIKECEETVLKKMEKKARKKKNN